MKIINSIFSFVLTLQIIEFMIFIILNSQNLNAIPLMFTINGINYNLEINFYAIITVCVVVFGILIVISVNIAGSGVNTEGVKNVSKMIGFVILFTILSIPNYTFNGLSDIWNLLTLFYGIAYVLKLIDVLISGGN